MNLKIKIKIIIICLSLFSHFVVHAQGTKKKPSWTETMPERKNAPGMQIQIDKDNDFGMDRGSFDFDRNELSDEGDGNAQDSSSDQLTNKIEIQKKLDEERKKNAAQSAKIEKLEAEKTELQRLAKQNQKDEQERIEAQELATQNQAEQERVEAHKLATQNQAEQERVEAQKLATQNQAEQERVEAQKLATQNQAEQEKVEDQKLVTQNQEEQEKVEAQRLATKIQQEQEEIEARRLAAQIQATKEEEAQALEALEVKKELPAKVEYNWKKIKNVAAVYPTKAARKRREGWVDIAIIIDTNGNVINSRVIKSSNDMRIFDKSALRAVRQWKYDPPANYGIKEQLSIVIRMTYKL